MAAYRTIRIKPVGGTEWMGGPDDGKRKTLVLRTLSVPLPETREPTSK